jgi:solute carrier family 10 (sodium/bile acid cotransporter), member 7
MLPLMIFPPVQLVVCAVIASRLGRAAQESRPSAATGGAEPSFG